MNVVLSFTSLHAINLVLSKTGTLIRNLDFNLVNVTCGTTSLNSVRDVRLNVYGTVISVPYIRSLLGKIAFFPAKQGTYLGAIRGLQVAGSIAIRRLSYPASSPLRKKGRNFQL